MTVGRPTKLTAAIQQKVCESLRVGNPVETAATFAGVPKTTFHRWLKQGARAPRGRYRDFYLAVEKARADAVTRNVAIVSKAVADGDWRAAAWFLERTNPDEFGRKDKIQTTVQGGIAHAHLDVGRVDLSNLSDEELDSLEKLLAKVIPASGAAADGSNAPGAGRAGAP